VGEPLDFGKNLGQGDGLLRSHSNVGKVDALQTRHLREISS